MSFQYTPAADRALHAAAAWEDPDYRSDIAPPALLMGLLEQAECRAAKLLEQRGIDFAAVLALRPGLERRGTEDVPLEQRVFLSRNVENDFRTAQLEILDENPRTCQIATEHILLGLATANDAVGLWLRERGIDPAAMEAEICHRYGIDHTPIPFDWSNDPIPLAETAEAAVEIIYDEPEDAPKPAAGRVGLIRVLDAAANRAGEALRVIEDHARFLLDDADLTRQCKELRHAAGRGAGRHFHERAIGGARHRRRRRHGNHDPGRANSDHGRRGRFGQSAAVARIAPEFGRVRQSRRPGDWPSLRTAPLPFVHAAEAVCRTKRP
ncbi:MAG: Clp protease N-terminal domain-containing protein [Pirellulales bacterium]